MIIDRTIGVQFGFIIEQFELIKYNRIKLAMSFILSGKCGRKLW